MGEQVERIEVPGDDGVIDALLYLPTHRAPLVVQYMDAGGLRPAFREMAAPLVDAGWAVLQPNLYRRSPPFAPFDFATVWTDPAERARIGALMNGFTQAQALDDTRRLLAALAGDPRVDVTRIGVLGYCMGGRTAFTAAGGLGAQVAAAASIHGGGLATAKADSPHRAASSIRARLYFAVADRDGSCTEADQAALAQALDAAGVRYAIERYPGALHGFAMPDFPVYDATAAARQWADVLALFRDTLPTP